MITVWMVQPAVYEIVDMVTMRHLFMSAVWTVHVWAVDFRRAVHGICGVDRDDMFVHVILVHMVKMAVVKIIHMAVMANRGVPAIQAMLMSVIGVMLLGAGGHDCVLSSFKNLSGPLVPFSLQPPGNWQLRKGRSCSRNRNESPCTHLNPVSVAGRLADLK
jgi:hypothetical protein